jgi:hypothetical protein
MAEDRLPFYFLDNTFRILVVDSDKAVLNQIRKIFAPMRMITLYAAASTREAEAYFISPDRIHLCILEPEHSDHENDDFYLLNKYANRAPFVICTGSHSPLKGFIAHESGAKALVEKGPNSIGIDFIRSINRHLLINTINPRYSRVKNTLNHSTDMLVKHSPKFVSQWAVQMAISDRELRHIWTKNLGANAKIILSIHQIFEAAFHYYERQLSGADAFRNLPVQQSDGYRRLEEFFHCHKSTIMDFVAFGNIAAILAGSE